MCGKLFTGFIFMEAYMIASGLGYREFVTKDDKKVVEYNAHKCGEYVNFMTSNSMMETTQSWNMGVHRWLKYYVMLRWMDRSKRSAFQLVPTLITYAQSGLWHGVDWGYHIFFFGMALMDVQHRTFMQTKLHSWINATLPWIFTSSFATFWTYGGICFFGINYERKDLYVFRNVYTNLYWWGFWLYPLLIVASVFVLPKKPRAPKTVSPKDPVSPIQLKAKELSQQQELAESKKTK